MGVLELLTWGAPPVLILLDTHLRCMIGDGFTLEKAYIYIYQGLNSRLMNILYIL